MQIQADELKKLLTKILAAAGSEQHEAEMVAGSLVKANLMGHDSHGAGLVPAYMKNIQDGQLIPNTAAKLIKDDGAIMMFDGAKGYGRRVAGEAMEAAIERCKETGVVLMTLKHAHHIGRVGRYAEMAMDAGLIYMSFVSVTNLPPLVATFSGADSRFGTNPITIGVPGTDKTPPTVADMATSIVAMGKVRVAMTEGVQMGEGYLIDADGQPTTDPNAILNSDPHGSILPFGLHKGAVLMQVVELLGGVFTQAGTIQPGNERSGAITNNMFTIVADPARLVEDQSWMKAEIDATIEYIKGARRSDPDVPVWVGGDKERHNMEIRSAEGIPLDETAWGLIHDAGIAVGLSEADLAEWYG